MHLPSTMQRRAATPALLFMLSTLWSCAASAQTAEPAPIALTFGSFFAQPIGPRGLEISEALRRADGKRVRLVGYMVAQEEPQPGRFLLTPRPVIMSEHADGEADDLPPATVTVLLDASHADHLVAHQRGLLALTGRLKVGRDENPMTGRVSWLRLQLDADAVAAHGPAAPAWNTQPSTALAP
jgi:hypothetical protein